MNIAADNVTIRSKQYPKGFRASKLRDTDGTIKKTLEVDSEKVLHTQLVTNARTFLGRKYDSYFKNGKMYDGQAKYDTVRKEWLVSYKTGHSARVKDKPLVCVDLIVEALRMIDPSFLPVPTPANPYYLRRVVNLEKEFAKHPELFSVEKYTGNTVVSV